MEADTGNLSWLNWPGLGEHFEKNGCGARSALRKHGGRGLCTLKTLHPVQSPALGSWVDSGHGRQCLWLGICGTPSQQRPAAAGTTAVHAALLEPQPGEEGIAPPFPFSFTDFLPGWPLIRVMKYFLMSVSNIEALQSF